ncbi:MAG: hypothetical protein JKY65_28505, partial [Planctomycetes bacterium]|nr:hypothetical protein [Planctomycetota bacterium]
MRGKHRSRQDYLALFAEQERSGLSLYAFARKEGISYSTLVPWRRRFAAEVKKAGLKKAGLKKAGPKKAKAKAGEAIDTTPQFLPVSIEATSLAPSSSQEVCEVRLRSGHELRIPPGFD